MDVCSENMLQRPATFLQLQLPHASPLANSWFQDDFACQKIDSINCPLSTACYTYSQATQCVATQHRNDFAAEDVTRAVRRCGGVS